MKLAHFRLVRVARVALGMLRVLPRYRWLVHREVSGRPVPRADWDRVHARAARELKRIALELEGGFTKVAQIFGARADVFPQAFIDELSQFHDAVPPRAFGALRPAVEADLGCPLQDVFAHVEPEALAAASLAQVHRARLLNGDHVVIKIQYPEVCKLIPLDLAMARRVARIVMGLQSRIDMGSLVREVTRFIELELDFPREAESTERLGFLLAEDDVVVPRVYRELCGERILVLEYIEGIQITRLDALEAAGHVRSDVARRVGDLYGSMLFRHGFFHGDPHPGNLLVLPDGRLGLLDFGLCKELPTGFARTLARLVVAAMIGDSDAAFEAARSLGFEVEAIRPEHLRGLMLSMLGDRDGDESVVEMIGDSRVRRIPEDFALVLRTLILLNGLSHRLAPGRRLVQGQLLQKLAEGAASAEPELAA